MASEHAGYRPIEVNASDERTKDALTERVTRAMESATLDLGGLRGEEDDDDDEGTGDIAGGRRRRKRGGKPNCIRSNGQNEKVRAANLLVNAPSCDRTQHFRLAQSNL